MDEFIAALRELTEQLPAPPISAFIGGALARGDDQLTDSVDLHLVAAPRVLAALRAETGTRLGELEERFDVSVDVHMLSRADLEARSGDWLEDVILLSGVPPSGLTEKLRSISTARRRTHADADADLSLLGRELAKRVRERPELADAAAEVVRRHLREAEPTGPSTDLDEWLRLLEHASPARIAQLLESDTERGRRLRQSPVVLRALSTEEFDQVRDAVHRAREKDPTRT